MTVDPGYAGQKIIKSGVERCKILHDIIVYNEYSTRIEVDGNINVENAAKLAHSGAEIFVLGTSSIFTPDRSDDLGEALVKFTSAVRTEMQVV
jgi:ribulose-phosphate 3-epimerase